MRTLKFRLWDDKLKQWLQGPNADNSLDGCNILGEMMLCGSFAPVSIERLNDLVVLQYTGLDDKNGKNIFEGDIVEYQFEAHGHGSVVRYSGKGDVFWNKEECQFGIRSKKYEPLTSSLKLKVVGQIYQEQDNGLVRCEQCDERAWDGRICHACGAKEI